MESRKNGSVGEEHRRVAARGGAAPSGRPTAGPATDIEHPGARRPSSRIGWQSALYVFVLGVVCLVLVPLTSLWWIVPVLGALVPLALAVLDGGRPGLGRAGDKGSKERELLGALAERGEITPATAAMRTSLTVDEAQKMLDGLARKGHLKLDAGNGTIAYSLPDPDRTPAAVVPPETGEGGRMSGRLTPGPPEDPLSERELEVLALLASGKTNAEISKDLYVALGTVKSHTGNVYRKLGAANRAEAVDRARGLGLLR